MRAQRGISVSRFPALKMALNAAKAGFKVKRREPFLMCWLLASIGAGAISGLADFPYPKAGFSTQRIALESL